MRPAVLGNILVLRISAPAGWIQYRDAARLPRGLFGLCQDMPSEMMELGLKRISAVWWSLIGFVLGMFIPMSILGRSSTDGGGVLMGVIGILAAYGLHRATCWIIDGFTKPS